MLTKTIIPDARSQDQQRRKPVPGGVARSLVLRGLKKIHVGQLEIQEGENRLCFGSPRPSEDLRACLHIHDARFYRAVALKGTLGAGESYIDRWWSCDDLTVLIRLILQNQSAFAELNGWQTRLLSLGQRCWHALRRNTLDGSKRNIAAHYDLSNDFYRLFLDETMTYSSGIFEHASSTLENASVAKLDRICQKLQLKPNDHVVEIGAGWGSFSIHAARNYGCCVTTTTISEQQYAYAKQKIAELGLEDRIRLLNSDYRHLEGQYDKLVSIEMIEAVGWQYYHTFFKKCSELLKPDGMACIQAITMADRFYEKSKHSVDYIKRYIFPGSCIPSVNAMSGAIAQATDMTLAHLEDMTPHYARTLRAWYEAFRDKLDDVRRLGFSESFIRMWEYYLCYCEAGFSERVIGNVQFVMVKPGYRGTPPMGAI